MKDYYWISGNCAAAIKAKNMKEACKKAIYAQLPSNPDSEEAIWFDKIKVVKGKLPKYCGINY